MVLLKSIIGVAAEALFCWWIMRFTGWPGFSQFVVGFVLLLVVDGALSKASRWLRRMTMSPGERALADAPEKVFER